MIDLTDTQKTYTVNEKYIVRISELQDERRPEIHSIVYTLDGKFINVRETTEEILEMMG